jgi:hypothetical protein
MAGRGQIFAQPMQSLKRLPLCYLASPFGQSTAGGHKIKTLAGRAHGDDLLSAFSYAQSRILLVFCRSPGFLIPWFSSLTAESDLADFLCCMEKKVGGLYLFFGKNYISLTC